MSHKPTYDELATASLMDPAERLRTFEARCGGWGLHEANVELGNTLAAFAADYEALRERVARLQETVTSLVGDRRG